MKASTKRIATRDYLGVLRDEKGRIVWECQHLHVNRDTGMESAYVCAATERKRREALART